MIRFISDRKKGQELLEFALILPILMVLVFGITDLGRAVFYYNTIFNAAREGARYAVIYPPEEYEDEVSVSNEVKNKIQNWEIGINIDPDDILVCWPSKDHVRIGITYGFQLITPFIGKFIGNPSINQFDIKTNSTMQLEYYYDDYTPTGCP